jgi:hypothetical protein
MMNPAIARALIVACTLTYIAGVHGTELLAAATTPTVSHSRDCGCVDGCSCRGPSKGGCCPGTVESLTTSCGCGCGGTDHTAVGSTWEGLLTPTGGLGAPDLFWRPADLPDNPHSWRLAYEHEHPPRFLS